MPVDPLSPIPANTFDRAAAGHLLRRLGYSAAPSEIDKAVAAGPLATVKSAFAAELPMPKPQNIDNFNEEAPEIRRQARSLSDEERRMFFDELRRKARAVSADYAVRWFDFASRPENGPQEKAVAWLQNIVVIGAQKIRHPGLLFDYQAMLRRNLYADYPALLRDVMRHPAMVRYLDLAQNNPKAPNENFARELFELFTLGEGNYTEQDIKEAARALTGIRLNDEGFLFDSKRHDAGAKTVFGQTGEWKPDDIIRLATENPAFPAFIAKDFLKTFVTPAPSQSVVEALGKRWSERNFRILALPEIVFTSDYFYRAEHRAALIKSPHEYYIGLCRDLRISTAAYPGDIINTLRVMGQSFFDPPNVRGWVGDKTWINASTITARRQLVAALFRPIDETRLNADDRAAIERARDEGRGPFRVDESRIIGFATGNSPEHMAGALCSRLLPAPPAPAFRATLASVLTEAPPGDTRILKDAIIALLQTPAYQLA